MTVQGGLKPEVRILISLSQKLACRCWVSNYVGIILWTWSRNFITVFWLHFAEHASTVKSHCASNGMCGLRYQPILQWSCHLTGTV